MPIDVTVVFHGLCAFVPNKPLGNPQDAPTAVWLFMPNFLKGGKVGDTPVDIHTPYLVADNTVLGLPGKGRSAIDLSGLDLRFEVTPSSVLKVTDDPGLKKTGALQWIPEARLIGPPEFAKVSPGLAADANPTRLAARLVIDSGKFGSWRVDKNKSLSIRGREKIKARSYAAFAAVTFKSVSGFKLVGRQFKSDDWKPVFLPKQSCEVHVGNLCEEEFKPLLAGVKWDPQDGRDRDFAGYFVLSTAFPKKITAKTEMPYPRTKTGGGGGAKCRKIIMEFAS